MLQLTRGSIISECKNSDIQGVAVSDLYHVMEHAEPDIGKVRTIVYLCASLPLISGGSVGLESLEVSRVEYFSETRVQVKNCLQILRPSAVAATQVSLNFPSLRHVQAAKQLS